MSFLDKPLLHTDPVVVVKVLFSVGAPIRVMLAPLARFKEPDWNPLLMEIWELVPTDQLATLKPDPLNCETGHNPQAYLEVGSRSSEGEGSLDVEGAGGIGDESEGAPRGQSSCYNKVSTLGKGEVGR
jgi:hypothetical protein